MVYVPSNHLLKSKTTLNDKPDFLSGIRKNIVTALLKQNIESTVFGDLEDRLAMVDKELADLQTQMISVSGNDAAVDVLGEQIDGLRAERQSILTEAAERSDLQERMSV